MTSTLLKPFFRQRSTAAQAAVEAQSHERTVCYAMLMKSVLPTAPRGSSPALCDIIRSVEIMEREKQRARKHRSLKASYKVQREYRAWKINILIASSKRSSPVSSDKQRSRRDAVSQHVILFLKQKGLMRSHRTVYDWNISHGCCLHVTRHRQFFRFLPSQIKLASWHTHTHRCTDNVWQGPFKNDVGIVEKKTQKKI